MAEEMCFLLKEIMIQTEEKFFCYEKAKIYEKIFKEDLKSICYTLNRYL